MGFRQRSLTVIIGEFVAQRARALALVKGDVIFVQGVSGMVTQKHATAFHDGRGGEAIIELCLATVAFTLMVSMRLLLRRCVDQIRLALSATTLFT